MIDIINRTYTQNSVFYESWEHSQGNIKSKGWTGNRTANTYTQSVPWSFPMPCIDSHIKGNKVTATAKVI